MSAITDRLPTTVTASPAPVTASLAAARPPSAPAGHPGPPTAQDVHLSRLRRKLGAHAGALQSLRGVGYRWSA